MSKDFQVVKWDSVVEDEYNKIEVKSVPGIKLKKIKVEEILFEKPFLVRIP